MEAGSTFTSPYLTTSEAAAYPRLSKSWLEKARLDGSGPPYSKIGARVIYSVTALDSWLDQHTTNSTSDTRCV